MKNSDRGCPFGLSLLEDRCVPATLTVNSIADDGGSAGELTLREAIVAINAGNTNNLTGDGDENQVDAEAFGSNDTILFDASLDGLTITLASDNQAITSTNDLHIDASNLTGGLTIDGDRRYRVFEIDTDNTTVTFDGLTIRQGDADTGGAIFINDSNVTVNLMNSIVSDNDSGAEGGIIHNDGGTLNVLNSTFFDNDASGEYCGTIYSNGTLYVTDSTFTDNVGEKRGGAITNRGQAIIRNSSISGSSASNGGGVFNGGFLVLSNSTLTDNDADYGGGLYSDAGSTTYVVNSTLSNNDVDIGGGGGIRSRGTLVVTNSTLTGNFASNSGTSVGGGGIKASGNTTISNSIITGNNSGKPGFDVFINSTNVTASNNIIGTDADAIAGTGASAFNDGDDFFADVGDVLNALADNGGPTQTHSLINNASNPAIDSGLNTLAEDEDGNDLLFDQRGFLKRIVNGTVDIGAYELDAYLVNLSSDADGQTLFTNSFSVTADTSGITNNLVFATNATVGPFVDDGATTTFTVSPLDDGVVNVSVGSSNRISVQVELIELTSDADGKIINDNFSVVADSDLITQDDVEISNGTIVNFVTEGGSTTITIAPTSEGIVKVSIGSSNVITTGFVEPDDPVEPTSPIDNIPITSEIQGSTFTAFYVAITANDLELSDVQVTGGDARQISDNGDGTFQVLISPDEVGTVSVSASSATTDIYSIEFTPLFFGKSDQVFVRNLYTLLFARGAANSEIQSWTNELSTGAGRVDVLAGFLSSQEYRGLFSSNAELIDGLYQTLFDREADSTYWVNRLNAGTSLESVLQSMLSSEEFYHRAVQETYNEFLRRPADELGLTFWVDQLFSTSLTIDGLRLAFATSVEIDGL